MAVFHLRGTKEEASLHNFLKKDLRYVGLMWSHFLMTPIIIIIAMLVVKNEHQNDTSYDEIEVCAQNIDTILGSIANITIGRAFMIT